MRNRLVRGAGQSGAGVPVGRAEELFTAMRSRFGARYADVLAACLAGFVLVVVVPGYSATLFAYFDTSTDDYLRIVLAFEISLSLAVPGVLAILRRRHPPIVRWLRGERGAAAAAAAWRSVVNDLPLSAAWVMALYVALCVPPAIYVADLIGLSAVGTLLYLAFLSFLVGGMGIVGYLCFEQAFRVIAREAAAELPEPFEPQGRPPSLGGKLLLLVLALNLFTASIVAAVSTNSLGIEGRLAITTATALLVTFTVALGLTLLLRSSLLGRLEGLRAAIRRVDGGDLSVRVPNLAGDELDDVGRSFNAMVSGLEERERLRTAFGSYVSPALAARVADGESLLKGEKVDVTIMFIDIVGYTSRFEQIEPEDIVADLNEFFETVIPPIEARYGYPNKMLGDGLLAIFGAPVKREDHAQQAFDAAREIQSAMAARYGDELRVGIGLNSGAVVVGSVGGAGRLDYTAIGDVVNTAARVEALTRETGDEILLTQATHDRLSDRLRVEPRGEVKLKGKAQGVSVYAPERADAVSRRRR